MIYLGDYTALCRNRFGQKMYVDTRDLSLAPHLLLDGDWERWVTDVMVQHMRGAIFIDVGANFGWYSCAASAVGAKKVHAFEPNRRLVDLLSRTAEVNGLDWDIWAGALSNSNGAAELSFSPSHFGGGTLVPSGQEEVEWIEQARFDDAHVAKVMQAAPLGQPVVFKVDAEGMDGPVLLGAAETLRDCNCTVFVEHTPETPNREELVRAYNMLAEMGYRASHVTKQATLEPLTMEQVWNVPTSDMLCFSRVIR
jgi:FkbM family methyltransferase